MSAARYDTSGLPEDQYQPGSDGLVLKNLLGITKLAEIEIVETTELLRIGEQLLEQVGEDQAFTSRDVCAMHRLWLGSVYSWAGHYRQVNISKSGFTFAMAHTIADLMIVFEHEQLQRFTPCRFTKLGEIVQALAEVHVKLMLIHPFREGNGRLGRLLSTLMALQAGLPPLDFGELAGERKEEYFSAVRAGLDRNYRPMEELFSAVIEKSS